MLQATHKQLGIDYSYGGWLENRAYIWRNSYLEKKKTFIHLGVDVNAPAGTPVAIDFDATVVRIDDDHDFEGGWGPRVIVRHEHVDAYIIYAHLARDIRVMMGEGLSQGDVLGEIGQAPSNGNWYPHVHVQVMTPKAYSVAYLDNFRSLDGYGATNKLPELKTQFRNPMDFIQVK